MSVNIGKQVGGQCCGDRLDKIKLELYLFHCKNILYERNYFQHAELFS